MTVVSMSQGELSRYDTLQRVERGDLRIDDAAMVLGLGRRQVFRLLDRMRAVGAEGLRLDDGGAKLDNRHAQGASSLAPYP
jgi:hypothetical protein